MMGPQGFSAETSGLPSSLAKKKRGRPRKYGPDGTVVSGRTLSPMPLSASSPPSAGYSDIKSGEPAGSGGEFHAEKKKRKMSSSEKSNMSLGDQITSGGSFTPHMVTVNPGEVNYKLLKMSGPGKGEIKRSKASSSHHLDVQLRKPVHKKKRHFRLQDEEDYHEEDYVTMESFSPQPRTRA